MFVTTTILAIGMTIAATFDLISRRVPNWLNVVVLLAGLLVRGILGGPGALALGLAGAGVGLALLIVPFARGLIGGGDVKLTVAAGAWLGPLGTTMMVVFGFAGGGVLALGILALGGSTLRREVATNLRFAWLARRAPDVPRRARRQLVPMAVALGAAATAVFVMNGGIR